MLIRKNIFLLCFLWCGLSGYGLHDSLINVLDFKPEKKEKGGLSITLNNGRLSNNISLNWLFFATDNQNHKLKTLNDSGFTVIDQTCLYFFNDEDDGDEKKKRRNEIDFNGFGWYKTYFKLPEGQDKKTYSFYYSQLGASEIYLDGLLIKEFGETGADGKTIKAVRAHEEYIPFYIPDTNVHVLAIRYSSSDYEKYFRKFGYNEVGPFIKFNDGDFIDIEARYMNLYFNVTNMLGAFFIALFIIHLLIYLFYREKTFNLYYSFFLLFLSLSFFEVYYVRFIEDPMSYLWINHVDAIFFPTCCFFLVTLLNKLLNVKRTKHYLFFVIAFIVFLITNFIHKGISEAILISLVCYTYFNTLAHAIVGIRRKIPGSKFLGWGVLSFTICLLIGITFAIVLAARNPQGNAVVFLFIAFVILAILSIPLSMTAYLAYDFSRTNKSLSDQLKANEKLHNEKQEILSNQNKVLETQVAERTREIAEQNKILEHQKKEITDSINYAKRIQQALLPEISAVKASLPNSFVFYLPKDIVSGDFYFFNAFSGTNDHPGRHHKTEEGGVLIAAADCTGHGVPGALMSMIVHEKLEAAVKLSSEPGEILHIINKLVKDALKQHQTENASRDGCDIALCRIKGDVLSYSGAYRPLYIFKKDNSFEEIKATKTAIAGLTPYEQKFEQHELKTPELKAVYMFSDGFADQFGGSKSKKLTTKKFKELLSSLVNLPVHEQIQTLESFFTGWKGNIEQIDDVLVIGITF